ncbi:MAG: M20/M25/M40 family metallo-hydrolase [Planctomycetes bacterium]|nr:M20/M25/M40 family metallo-hydrolase [Planctomycetota bacterium]
MKPSALEQHLLDWIEIPSITGDEAHYGEALEAALKKRGFDVQRQEVEPGRFNLLARAGRPEVVFCTHLDTVPPFFGARLENGVIHGRGSCDAKGQAAAMLFAGERLLAAGEDRVAFLFTVGEETLSDGAAYANRNLADPWAPKHVIVGEPTESRFVAGHKGLFHAHLEGHGVAGHSSQPIGPSAVHELILAAARALAADWGHHERLGPGTLNLGQIEGGVASNVVADHATVSFLLRAVEEPEAVRARLLPLLGEHVELVQTGNCYGPVEFLVPDGEPSDVVAFGTDAPHLRAWGTPLMIGAGSILDAHTDHEHIRSQDLEALVGRHVKTVQYLCERIDAQ